MTDLIAQADHSEKSLGKVPAAQPVNDERIITNAMLHAERLDRIEQLEGLLREALGALMGDFEVNPRDVRDRIEAALKEGA